MSRGIPRLHVVTDDRIAARSDLAGVAAAIAAAGPVALHARAPAFDGRRATALARTLAATGAPVIVNDRADIAVIVGAAGVHLPEHGLPVAAARRVVGDRWIGRSTHDADAARRAARDGADYVFLGPIWPTRSHPHRAALGVHVIEQAAPARVIAIGGITPDRVRQCLTAGAYGVAVISAVWDAAEPGSVVGEMMVDFR